MAARASLPFVDLQAQRRRLAGRIEAAIAAVLAHGQFVMGPEVARLEQALAAYAGARHVISCASGTDALLLVLMARGLGPGDAVFVPGFTFAASAEAVALRGATPVFVDVEPATCNLDPASLEEAIAGDAARRPADAPGGDRGRSVRPAGGLSAVAGDRPRARAVPAAGRGPELRRALAGRARRPPGRCGGDQLLSDQAARRLWRWRRGADRRRAAGRGGAAAAAAWRAAGARALPAPADRPQQPARHPPGGDPAGQARRARGGDRRAGRRSRRATTRRSAASPCGRPRCPTGVPPARSTRSGCRRGTGCGRRSPARAFRARSTIRCRCTASPPIATSRPPLAGCRSPRRWPRAC